MEVLVDSKKSEFNIEEMKTVGDLLTAIDHLLAVEGRVRVNTDIDGENLTGDNAEALFAKKSADTAMINLITEDSAQLARQTLTEAKSVLPEIKKAFEEVSYQMQAGKKEEAFDELQKTFVKWRDIIQLFHLVEGFLKVDYKVIFVGEKTIDEINSELLELLTDTKAAMVDADLVTLSDLLEYEIAPKIDDQMSIIAELLK
ncbi:hypothetical protein ACFLT7_05735 [candidate division KSB1 bacterium]